MEANKSGSGMDEKTVAATPADASVENDPSGGAAPCGEQLAEIDQLLAKIGENRRRQALWTGVGMIVILVILVIFMVNLANFAYSFDTGKLSDALLRRGGTMLVQSPEIQEIQRDFRTVFIPAYQAELSEQFQKRLPELTASLEKESEKLVQFSRTELRERVNRRLMNSFEKMEKHVLAKYEKSTPSPEQLQKGLEKFQANLDNDMAVVLDRNLANAKTKLFDLYATCLAFQEGADYRAIAKLPPGEVENLLLETFLELWIYNLNPARGAARAASGANGGI